jgi:signal transduction histidine kinase
MYDVTGTMEKREALRRETEHANLSVKQKSIFMANMSHEIRTPLNAIVGFSQVLETLDEGDERKEVLNIICQNSDVLLRLINDILDASTMGSSLTIEPKNINFAREFDNICQTLSQRINNPEVEFIVSNSLVDLHINLDMARIQQVIYNFFTNAMKYTSKGYIKLGYRYSVNDGLYIYCEDTGTGIPKDKQSSIFEQFVKLNDFVQGTGLGLNICKTIVEKCGGTIGVNSEEGKGSTFWIKLPVNVVPSDSTPA